MRQHGERQCGDELVRQRYIPSGNVFQSLHRSRTKGQDRCDSTRLELLLEQEVPRLDSIETFKNSEVKEALRFISLNFTILLSSVAGVLGLMSQAYNAAKVTLQAAPSYPRQTLGLPGLTIDVDFVVDIGCPLSRSNLVQKMRDYIEGYCYTDRVPYHEMDRGS